LVAIPRSLTSSLLGFWRKGGPRHDVAAGESPQDLAPTAIDPSARPHHPAVADGEAFARSDAESRSSYDLVMPVLPDTAVDAFGPPHLLAASGILASEYYAGQARSAEVTGSQEWIRTPSCNIARDEMAAQGVCDGPDDPLGAVAAPSASYAPLLSGALAALAVGMAAGGGGGSGGSGGAHAASASDVSGGDGTASHVGALAALSGAADASSADAASTGADASAAQSLAFDAGRLATLEAQARHGDAPHVDGTAGIDTLSLVGHSVTLDLDLLSRLGTQFASIEKVDLAGGGNRLAVNAADVLQMSGTDLFNAGNGWSGLGAHVERHQMVVDGGAGDTLSMGAGWQSAGATVQHDGHSYAVFNATDSMAQLLVASQVSVVG
jgi:hypothetical protein